MDMSSYRLTRDAYVCLADDYLVFSNLSTDKYQCLDRTNTQTFLAYLPAFQGISTRDHVTAEPAQARRIVQTLARKGLLADGAVDGRQFQPINIPTPSASLVSATDAALRSHVTFRDMAVFLRASLQASVKLRVQPLRQTTRTVERRRCRALSSHPNDQQALRALVATFQLLRPYYPRSYLCRFDSLALIEYLAQYNQYPLWVFGVKGKPFRAHCWVQEGEVLLNDSLDYVKRYTPIMAF